MTRDGRGGGVDAFGVRVRGLNWTSETRLYYALVRRLGGFVELTREEVEPGPDDGLVMSGEGGSVRMQSDTFACRPPRQVTERFRNDPAFHRLCHELRGIVERDGFSVSDIVDAAAVACDRATGQGGLRWT